MSQTQIGENANNLDNVESYIQAGKKKTLVQGYSCCKFQLFTISLPYPHAQRLLERQSHNNHMKLKLYRFLRIIFLGSFPVPRKW